MSEQTQDILPRKRRKSKRKANLPLNDTNNVHEHSTQRGTQVSSRKASRKGKPVSGVNMTKTVAKPKTIQKVVVFVTLVPRIPRSRPLVIAFRTLVDPPPPLRTFQKILLVRQH